MHRSAAWIDWIVRESFTDAHRRALYLVTTSGGEPVAYVLLKARVYSSVTKWNLERFNLGSVVDWRIFEPERVGPGAADAAHARASSTTGASRASRCAFRPSPSRCA